MAQLDYEKIGLHYLAASATMPIVLMADFPVNTWDDLKGKQGFVDPIVQDMFVKMGAAPVEVPGFDMYSAMKLGTTDFILWTLAELETSKLKEVVTHVVMDPVIYPCVEDIYVNEKAWESIGPELQTKVSNAVILAQWDLGWLYRHNDNKAIALAKEYGVKFVTMPTAEKAEYANLARGVWDDIAKKSPECAEAVQMVKDFAEFKGR